MQQPVVIGIAVLDHHAYYHDLSHLPPEERAAFNFDHPDALQTALMRRQLDVLLGGEAIEKPRYNFSTHSREPGPSRSIRGRSSSSRYPGAGRAHGYQD